MHGLIHLCLPAAPGLPERVSMPGTRRSTCTVFSTIPPSPPDNNRAENAIRPFVVGRKNWLFSDSEKGAEASAILYSLAATACANGLTVEGYFIRLFTSKYLILPWHTDEQK